MTTTINEIKPKQFDALVSIVEATRNFIAFV